MGVPIEDEIRTRQRLASVELANRRAERLSRDLTAMTDEELEAIVKEEPAHVQKLEALWRQ
jgi:hypothetical protein